MNFDSWRHQLRARFFKTLRQPDKAIAEYELALGFEPDSATILHRLAYLYAAKDARADAERCFLRVTALDPANPDAWFNLGFLHERHQEPEKAVAPFREAARLNPVHDRAWYGLGLALAHLHRHAEAAEAFEKAATLQPMNPHAWYHYGMARHHLNDPDKVKEIILHLNRFDPKMARELIRDANRSDLAHLVADLRV